MTSDLDGTFQFGVRPLPDHLIRSDLDKLSDLQASSPLDIQIKRLLALHPDLRIRFRNQDLASLDHLTKQALLDDVNDVLGIILFRKRQP